MHVERERGGRVGGREGGREGGGGKDVRKAKSEEWTGEGRWRV